MKFKFILGVDQSKEWFHYCLIDQDLQIILEDKVDNNPEAIFIFIDQLLEKAQIENIADVILVVEHTGIYVKHLTRSWMIKGGQLSIVPAFKISQFLGGLSHWEEKTDQMDARRIAEYGARFSDKLTLWQAEKHTLALLQCLERQRRRFLDAINLLKVPVKEDQEFQTMEISQILQDNQSEALHALKAGLKIVEKNIGQLIDGEPELKKLFRLITSVPGVGAVTAREVIIATSAFTKFTPSQAKSFAKYSGVAPIKKESGKIKKRDRIPKRANKKIKTVLTMGATSLIGSKTELGIYYQRKIEEGKKHYSVINAIRNKLILRIFSVVRNQVMYEKNLNYC